MSQALTEFHLVHVHEKSQFELLVNMRQSAVDLQMWISRVLHGY